MGTDLATRLAMPYNRALAGNEDKILLQSDCITSNIGLDAFSCSVSQCG